MEGTPSKFALLWTTLVSALILSPGPGASPARAFSGGITGRSGKQGPICTQCHGGGRAPLVHFEGPDHVATGATATFRFVIQSQAPATQTFAGFNVATSGGELQVIAGQGERRVGSGSVAEITHVSPKANVDGEAVFEFAWAAPASPAVETLFGAGNSVNRNFNNSGDFAASTTFDVTVEGSTQTATPTATPTVTPTPTATPTLGPCVGDCDHDGTVGIDELVIGVDIALGRAAGDACPEFDVRGDPRVTVDELAAAVSAAINGCR
jgi:hypothetical protein